MEVYVIKMNFGLREEYITGMYQHDGGCYPTTTTDPMLAKHYTSKGRARNGLATLRKKLEVADEYNLEVVKFNVETKLRG